MNILLNGIGGQGVITLKRILTYAALKEKEHFVASELHGLAQKGGSINVHFRLGKGVFSPIIPKGEANLIIGLDLLEAARDVNFSSKKTIYLVNNYFNPFFQLSSFREKDFLKVAERKTRNIYLVKAAEICRDKLGNNIYEGSFLLGFGFREKLLPFKKSSLVFGFNRVLPEKILKKNIEAFKLGEEHGRK